MNKLKYWDYRYTDQRMKNDMRSLKHHRRFYSIQRIGDKWIMDIPIMIHYQTLARTKSKPCSLALSGVMCPELWKKMYNTHGKLFSSRSFQFVGAELIKFEPTLPGMINTTKELKTFWADLPIRVWCERDDGEWGYEKLPTNDSDLVAFILKHC
jgi:hypothetical protein